MNLTLDPRDELLLQQNKANRQEAFNLNLLKPFDIENQFDREVVYEGLKLRFKSNKSLDTATKELNKVTSKINSIKVIYRTKISKVFDVISRDCRELAGIMVSQELLGNKLYTQEDCRQLFEQFINTLNSDGETSIEVICNHYWQPVQSGLRQKSGESFNTGRRFSSFSGRMVYAPVDGVHRLLVTHEGLPIISDKSFDTLRGIIKSRLRKIGAIMLTRQFNVDYVMCREVQSGLVSSFLTLRNTVIKQQVALAHINKTSV